MASLIPKCSKMGCDHPGTHIYKRKHEQPRLRGGTYTYTYTEEPMCEFHYLYYTDPQEAISWLA